VERRTGRDQTHFRFLPRPVGRRAEDERGESFFSRDEDGGRALRTTKKAGRKIRPA
jgi:hypothetical protein